MPSTSKQRIKLHIRSLIFGSPLDTKYVESHKIGVLGGIPVFGGDLISSEGYAPDEMLYVLSSLGAAGFAAMVHVSLGVILLLGSILLVYRRAIQRNSNGGGSYTIARQYLGEKFGLLAAASLSLDYILTAAVSISSAIENITGIFPWLGSSSHKVFVICLIILFMSIINLRGLKESAKVFALPVYIYIFSIFALVSVGIIHVLIYGATPIQTIQPPAPTGNGLTFFLFLRALAGGTTALTGIEAVSNGVSAFKAPAQRRAISTLFVLGFVVVVGLGGISYLASVYHIVPTSENTTMNHLGLIVFGKTSMYYLLLVSAGIILVIAANTPFAGLPILLSLMAHDGYAPGYFKHLGDRLVYDWGIWLLTVISLLLVLIFHGNTHAMIPLFAIGVLLSFALTGISLAKNVLQQRKDRWVSDFIIFSFGGIVSFSMFAVFLITKFSEGAWVVTLILPSLVLFFNNVGKVYRIEKLNRIPTKEDILRFKENADRINNRRISIPLSDYRGKIIIPVFDLSKGVLKAIIYALELTPLVTAVHIASDTKCAENLKHRWEENDIGIQLEIIPSPFRATIHELVKYLDEISSDPEVFFVNVAIPEYVPEKIWHNVMHNQTGQLLKLMLLGKENIFVTSITYHQKTEL
ncbi:APC family permease [Desulfosporosinus sp. SB140]|uniref:APC family permease n=1 Tax=Desulfosporosinus paludis TaxID=3115649 RepID=UPI003890F4C5